MLRLVKKRYAFHMNDDSPTIEGLLVKRTRREFVLLDAEIVQEADRTIPLTGRVEVLRENVYVLQEIK